MTNRFEPDWWLEPPEEPEPDVEADYESVQREVELRLDYLSQFLGKE